MDRLRRREVFAADGYPVAGAVVELASDVPSHTHDFLEVAVVVDGSPIYLSPSGPQRLGAGAVCAVRPGGWHGWSDASGAVIGNLYLGEELLLHDLRWLLDIGGLGRFLLRGGTAPERLDTGSRTHVREHLTGLAALRATRSTSSVAHAVGRCCAILGALADIRLDESRAPAFSPPVRRVLDLLGNRPADAWSMAALSAAVGHSPSHLHRAFRAQLGMSPMAWLARTRAELAASLLLQTDHPVAAVGRAVGWPDPNYFSRRFRHEHGMSPTTYRERNHT